MAGAKKVNFKFVSASAHEVKLCGNFTSWEQGAIYMTRGRAGEWKAQVSLNPGEYEYKFVADGVWLTDPKAERQTMNDRGSQNSVRVVK